MVQCVLRNTIEHLGNEGCAHQRLASGIIHQSQPTVAEVDLGATRKDGNGNRRHGGVEGPVVHLEREGVRTGEAGFRSISQVGNSARQCSVRRLRHHGELQTSPFRITTGQGHWSGFTHHQAQALRIGGRSLVDNHIAQSGQLQTGKLLHTARNGQRIRGNRVSERPGETGLGRHSALAQLQRFLRGFPSGEHRGIPNSHLQGHGRTRVESRQDRDRTRPTCRRRIPSAGISGGGNAERSRSKRLVQRVFRGTIENPGSEVRPHQSSAAGIIHQRESTIVQIDLTTRLGHGDGDRRHSRVEGSIVYLECEQVRTGEARLRRIGQIGSCARQCSIRRLSDHRKFDRSAFRIPAGEGQ